MIDPALKDRVHKVEDCITAWKEAQVLLDAVNEAMEDVARAAFEDNNRAELLVLAEILPENHPYRQRFAIAAEVNAKGLPQFGQRPAIDPSTMTIGTRVVASDQYLRDHYHLTGENDIALDTGVIMGIHFSDASTGKRLLGWAEGAQAEVNVFWNDEEVDPCLHHYLTKL